MEQENLKRLHWKTDKEQILNILHRVNVKYLLALHKKARHRRRLYYENYTTTVVTCKYDGCIFNVSCKSLRDEIRRRGLL